MGFTTASDVENLSATQPSTLEKFQPKPSESFGEVFADCPTCGPQKLKVCACKGAGASDGDADEAAPEDEANLDNTNTPQHHLLFTQSNEATLDDFEDELGENFEQMKQNHYRVMLKPQFTLNDVKTRLEKYILALAEKLGLSMENKSVKALGEALGIHYELNHNALVVTMQNPEHHYQFLQQLDNAEMILMPEKLQQALKTFNPGNAPEAQAEQASEIEAPEAQAEQASEIEAPEESSAFNPTPFKMTPQCYPCR